MRIWQVNLLFMFIASAMAVATFFGVRYSKRRRKPIPVVRQPDPSPAVSLNLITVLNELPTHFPDFLKHYRTQGVGHFHIIQTSKFPMTGDNDITVYPIFNETNTLKLYNQVYHMIYKNTRWALIVTPNEFVYGRKHRLFDALKDLTGPQFVQAKVCVDEFKSHPQLESMCTTKNASGIRIEFTEKTPWLKTIAADRTCLDRPDLAAVIYVGAGSASGEIFDELAILSQFGYDSPVRQYEVGVVCVNPTFEFIQHHLELGMHVYSDKTVATSECKWVIELDNDMFLQLPLLKHACNYSIPVYKYGYSGHVQKPRSLRKSCVIRERLPYRHITLNQTYFADAVSTVNVPSAFINHMCQATSLDSVIDTSVSSRIRLEPQHDLSIVLDTTQTGQSLVGILEHYLKQVDHVYILFSNQSNDESEYLSDFKSKITLIENVLDLDLLYQTFLKTECKWILYVQPEDVLDLSNLKTLMQTNNVIGVGNRVAVRTKSVASMFDAKPTAECLNAVKLQSNLMEHLD
uniref:Uncharacterized protein n=1 Tax=viral metagenome TaxID=1070528 RepID=A0A6C0CJZ6_9ZZZZ